MGTDSKKKSKKNAEVGAQPNGNAGERWDIARYKQTDM